MSGTKPAGGLSSTRTCHQLALSGLVIAVSLACGGISAVPGEPIARAGSGGRAGGGDGGSAGSEAGDGGSAGSAGSSGEAGSAGASGATGSGGSGGVRPAGCPEPTPIPVPGQTIVIQSINMNTAEIILRNATSSPQSIVLGRQGWQWCAYPRYWSFTDEQRTLELAPGETYAFIAINNQSGAITLFPDEGEMAVYSLPGVFEEYEYMQGFVAWGVVQAFRESYAVEKGLWTFGERIEIDAGDAGFIATGETDRASGYTSAPARCLVP
jgi:hypothetical protein